MFKKIIFAPFVTILFAPYMCAYGIAHLLKLKGKEDMPTPKEWFEPLTETN